MGDLLMIYFGFGGCLLLYGMFRLFAWAGRSGDGDSHPMPKAYRERRSSLQEYRAQYPAMLNNSEGGLGMPYCQDPHYHAALSGNSWRQVSPDSVDLHGGNIDFDHYGAIVDAAEQLRIQGTAYDPIPPAHEWRNDQDLRQPPPWPVVQQYIPLDLSAPVEPVPDEGYTEAQVQDGNLVYVRIGRG